MPPDGHRGGDADRASCHDRPAQNHHGDTSAAFTCCASVVATALVHASNEPDAVALPAVERRLHPAQHTAGRADRYWRAPMDPTFTSDTKYDGWIENVAVNYLGETVAAGQVLFDIYSPQLVSTQMEYLQAVDYAARLATVGVPRDRRAGARARHLVPRAAQLLGHR